MKKSLCQAAGMLLLALSSGLDIFWAEKLPVAQLVIAVLCIIIAVYKFRKYLQESN